jgi:hypothetical protein
VIQVFAEHLSSQILNRFYPDDDLRLLSLPTLATDSLSLSSFLARSRKKTEYIHAKEMYSIRDISSPKLIYGTAVAAVVGVGVSIPIFAVNFQQSKAG